VGAGQSRLPGLYTSRAATVGDGILLPLLAYSLVQSVDLRRFRDSTYQTAFSLCCGVLGAVIGAGVEVYDLSDPTAPLDWTFPAPHRYNLPGWYHTIFLIIAAGFFGWALGLALVQLRAQARQDPEGASRRLRSVGCLGALFPGLAFVCLLEEDDLTVYPHLFLIMLATMIGMGLVLGALLTWACGPHEIRSCALAIVGSVLPAVALCLFFWPGRAVGPWSVLLAVIIGLGAVAVVRYRLTHGRAGPAGIVVTLAVTVAVCAAGPAYAIWEGYAITLPSLFVCCLTGLALASCEFWVLAPLVL
jgi:hypothetical protein